MITGDYRRCPKALEGIRTILKISEENSEIFHYRFVVIFTYEKDIFRQRKDTIFLVKEILAAGGIHVVCSIPS